MLVGIGGRSAGVLVCGCWCVVAGLCCWLLLDAVLSVFLLVFVGRCRIVDGCCRVSVGGCVLRSSPLTVWISINFEGFS